MTIDIQTIRDLIEATKLAAETLIVIVTAIKAVTAMCKTRGKRRRKKRRR